MAVCWGVLLAGHCWKHSSGQERGQPQPVEGVVAVVEPLEGSRVSGFRLLLRGKISLQNIYLKIQRQLLTFLFQNCCPLRKQEVMLVVQGETK